METQAQPMFSAETRSTGSGLSLVLGALVVVGTLFGGMLLAVSDYTHPVQICERVDVVDADGHMTTQVRRC